MIQTSEKYVSSLLAQYRDLGQQNQTELSEADFSLEAMHRLMQALENPERGYASIHIAGTNGKGSVSALSSAALEAQGYKVGSYTSPHLVGPLAGIRVNGKGMAFDEAADLLKAMREALDALPEITYFEVVTALAFLYFAKEEVDVAVVEVGLGGRLDATNVLNPSLSIITPIDLEHQSVLGNSLEEIAKHKGGIIKKNTPVVMAPQSREVRIALYEIANEASAKVVEVGRDVHVARGDFGGEGQEILLWSGNESPSKLDVFLRLHGQVQAENAATAYAGLIVLDLLGTKVGDEAIRAGFGKAEWPGRFEIISSQPTIVLDAAHTPAASLRLAQALDDYFPEKRIVGLMGISGDKNLKGLLAPLRERLDFVVATQSAQGRSMAAQQLAEQIGAESIETLGIEDPVEAFQKAKNLLGENSLLLVFGSVFLVEQIGELE